ncbi:MAG: glycosyltransferase family 39 protein [bacterium]|nr:glycosyltransferase family 39 protein [bacterium]
MKNIRKWLINDYILIPTLIVWTGWVFIRYHQQHPDFYTKITPLFEPLILLVFLFSFIIISFGIGHKILKLFKFQISILEVFLFSTGIGLGILMYATFILGVVGWLYPVSFYILMLLGGILGINEFKILIPSKKKNAGKKVNVFSISDVILWSILFYLTVICFVRATTPAIAWDTLTYHLNLPRLYLTHHKFYPVPYNVWSNFPLNIEMLFMLCLGLKGICLAKLIHWAFGILISILLYSFSLRYFTHKIGLLAAVIFLTNPVVIFEKGTAYIDLGLTFYYLVALYGFFIWLDSKNDRWIILMAIFSGIGLGSKYTQVFGVFSLGVGIILKYCFSDKARFRQITKKLFIFFGIAFLFVVPWLIKSYLYTGNPLYPRFYSLLGGSYWDAELARQYSAWMHSMGMERGLLDYLLLPWNLVVYGNPGHVFYDGTLNPLGLIFIPLLLFLPRISKIIIYLSGFSLLFFICWASGFVCPHKIRFLMPILPLLGLLSAYTIENLIVNSKWLKKFHIAIYLVIAVILLSVILPNLQDLGDRLRVMIGTESKEAFLNRSLKHYEMCQYINKNLPASAKILFLWENRGYFCERTYIADSFFEVSQMLKLIRDSHDADGLLKKLKGLKITHVLINKNLASLFYQGKEEDVELKIIGEFLDKYTELEYSKNNVDLFRIK